jgi:hypothetical protein
MVDFVKIVINSKPLVEHIKKNDKWEAYQDSGQLLYKLDQLTFEVYESGRVVIRGSLHKYSQGNNWGNFTRLDLWDTIAKIRGTLLWIEPEKLKLENIEIGVNIETDFDPSEFVKNNVILYKDETFKRVKTKEFITGTGVEVCKSEYRIKVYDKGKKEGRQNYILRFEVHFSKMTPLKKTGIASLADLLDESKLEALGTILSQAWEEVLIVEHLAVSELTKAERRQYENATNPRYWQTITRKQRTDLKRNYRAIVEKYVGESRKKKIGEAIRKQWTYLLKDSKTGNVFTTPQKERFDHLCKRSKRYQNTICELPESDELIEAESSKTGNVFTAPQKVTQKLKKGRRGYRGHLVLKEMQRNKEAELRRQEAELRNKKAELRNVKLKLQQNKIKSASKM